MTKADLVSRIVEKTGVQKQEVEKIMESFFLTIKDSMSSGENIYFRGFGSFVNKQRAQKTARNISLKTSIIIPSHVIPHFKASQEFIDQVKEANLTEA